MGITHWLEMDQRSDDEGEDFLEGISANADYEDYMDSDGANIAFGVVILIYILALMVFYAGPLLENSFQADTILMVMVYWAVISKTLIPLATVVFSVFNFTNFPLTLIILAIIASGALNSLGFAVDLVYAGVTANAASAINNIANDPLWCCVYYSVPNSGCQLTDGPCTAGYPQTKADLALNDSFVFYYVMVIILFGLEVALLVFTLVVRQTKIQKQKEFFKQEVTTLMDKDSGPPNDRTLTARTERMISQNPIMLKANRMIRSALHEIGRIPSQTGFTGNVNLWPRKRKME
jgi:hypothetical protein